jgi:hypothetical protein
VHGKALSLVVVIALVAAGAVQASTTGRSWVGHTARGGNLDFVKAGKRINHVRAEVEVTCTNEVEGSSRDTTEYLSFEKIVRIGRGGRVRTTAQYDAPTERWTLTFAGTVGTAKARGTITWRYESARDGNSCVGKGSTRWKARPDRS